MYNRDFKAADPPFLENLFSSPFLSSFHQPSFYTFFHQLTFDLFNQNICLLFNFKNVLNRRQIETAFSSPLLLQTQRTTKKTMKRSTESLILQLNETSKEIFLLVSLDTVYSPNELHLHELGINYSSRY